MKHKIPCEIIQDLLPSYVDDLVSDVTKTEIKEHIDSCETCKRILKDMKHPMGIEEGDWLFQEEKKQEEKELDFLRKTRRHSLFIAIGCMIAAIVIAGVIIFANIYLVGTPIDPNTVACNVKVEDQTITMQGRLLEEGQCFTSVEFVEEDGVVTLFLEGAKDAKMFARPNEFSLSYDAEMPFVQIELNNRVVWENGVPIDRFTVDVFKTRHDYVGDMVANNQTASALGIMYDFDYINELQTAKTPYEWIFVLQDTPRYSQEQATGLMEYYATVIFAMISNLDVVTFENPDGSIYATYTTMEISKNLGIDVKKCGESLADFQMLLETVGLDKLKN